MLAKYRVGRFLVWGMLLGACGGIVGKPTVGGESHFLRKCGEGSGDCGTGLTCVAGVCTRGCLVRTDKCDDLFPQATCTDESIEPGELAVCDVSCVDDMACSGLGNTFVCNDGFCRGPSVALPSTQPGTGTAGSGASGTAGNGTTATAGAGSTNNPPRSDLYTPPLCSGDAPVVQPCPAPLECVTVPGSAAEPVGFCVETSGLGCTMGGSTRQCPSDFECTGPGGEGQGRCAPTLVNCTAPYSCLLKKAPDPCPYGYEHARTNVVDGVAECIGQCVPIQTCGCSKDEQCPSGSVCNDGTCAELLPWQPPQLCSLPFDPGPCKVFAPVFAVVDGVCQAAVYGGCQGNDNRFRTLEECMATCEGRPQVNACPEGRVNAKMTSVCGVTGGKLMTACAQPCEKQEDCDDPRFNCFDGLCQAGGCL